MSLASACAAFMMDLNWHFMSELLHMYIFGSGRVFRLWSRKRSKPSVAWWYPVQLHDFNHNCICRPVCHGIVSAKL